MKRTAWSNREPAALPGNTRHLALYARGLRSYVAASGFYLGNNTFNAHRISSHVVTRANVARECADNGPTVRQRA
jgi:hypothetical protein